MKTTPDKDINRILENVVMHCYGNIWFDKSEEIKNPVLSEAKQAIQALIDQKVREARVEERVKLAKKPLAGLPSIFLNDKEVQARLKEKLPTYVQEIIDDEKTMLDNDLPPNLKTKP